jgi:chromosomal replication initiation ATPase DnaA
MKEIFEIFELLYGKNEAYIKQKTNKHEVAQYRFLFMYVLHEFYHLGWTQIQKEFDCKAHKTVMNAVLQIHNWKQSDLVIKNRVELLEFIFKPIK